MSARAATICSANASFSASVTSRNGGDIDPATIARGKRSTSRRSSWASTPGEEPNRKWRMPCSCPASMTRGIRSGPATRWASPAPCRRISQATGAPSGKFSHASSSALIIDSECWAVMIPAKLWTERRGDAWSRRVVMLLLGAGVGVLALWLDGWGMPFTNQSASQTLPAANAGATYSTSTTVTANDDETSTATNSAALTVTYAGVNPGVKVGKTPSETARLMREVIASL